MRTIPTAPRFSNTLYYLAPLFLAFAFGLHAEGQPAEAGKPCCPPAKPPCCAADAKVTDPHAGHAGHAAAELPPGDFTRESLYQIETTFTDDAGRPFALGSLKGRPVVLTMFFASCNYACPLLVADMTRIRESLPPAVRERAAIVLVSFDSERDTPAALHAYRESRSLDASWILLHGSGDAVRELAALLGAKFKRETDGQFAHSNLISILNPAGEIVHQRAGLKGGLDEAGAALAIAAR
jgi:protein SCO1/2